MHNLLIFFTQTSVYMKKKRMKQTLEREMSEQLFPACPAIQALT